MKIIFLFFSSLCFVSIACNAQMPDYNIDSMVSIRKLDSLDGTVKSYYSPGNKERAIKAQKLLENAVGYYTQKYKKPFGVKLLMLDSTQWVYNIVPWGFNFFNNGWAIVNTGVNPDWHLQQSIPKSQRQLFDSILHKQNLTLADYMFSYDMVTVIHELGHHYIMKIRKIANMSMWFNEIGADYFAYNFFEKQHVQYYRQIMPFLSLTARYGNPQYKEIISWDTLNIKMPLDNFLWFDAQTQILVEKIYAQRGELFLDNFFKTFQGKKPEELGLEYTIKEINSISNGMVNQWRIKMRKQ
jgi:hypothetical protein